MSAFQKLAVWGLGTLWLTAWAVDPYVKNVPLPDYPRGEVRFTTGIVTETRERIPTGQIYYNYKYFDGAGPDATELGELSFKMSADGKTVKWGRVDANVQRKGIGTLLYREAVESPSFAKVSQISTTWTDENAATFQEKRFEGLGVRESAALTPSAKMFGRLGWDLDTIEATSDRLSVTYRRADDNIVCDFVQLVRH